MIIINTNTLSQKKNKHDIFHSLIDTLHGNLEKLKVTPFTKVLENVAERLSAGYSDSQRTQFVLNAIILNSGKIQFTFSYEYKLLNIIIIVYFCYLLFAINSYVFP
jgi:hypothetical protein